MVNTFDKCFCAAGFPCPLVHAGLHLIHQVMNYPRRVRQGKPCGGDGGGMSHPEAPLAEASRQDTEAVAASALTVKLGRRTVLAGVDFSIPAGRITGLLGPSGSGAPTLMRTIVGA